MKKKICNLYSMGSLDQTQGGGSLFNYYFIKYLLNKNYYVNATLFGNKDFYKTQVNFQNIIKNKNLKVRYIILKDKYKFNLKNNFFLESINKFFYYQELLSYFLLNKNKINSNDINVTRGFGFACIFSKFNIKNINLLDDPKVLQVKSKLLKSSDLLLKIKQIIIYFLFKNIYKKISLYFKLNNFCKFYTHSPHHVLYFNENNIKCKHITTFQKSNQLSYINEVKKFFLKNQKRNFINICFVGSLDTTASKLSIENSLFFFKNLNKKIKINIFFLSDSNKKFKNFENVNIYFVKKKVKLNDFMKKMHFGIYLGDYNIGIRQRIIFMMSYGVPVLCHINNKDSLIFLTNNKDIIYYKDENDLYKVFNKLCLNQSFLLKLKTNSFFSQRKFYDMKKNIELFYKEVVKKF